MTVVEQSKLQCNERDVLEFRGILSTNGSGAVTGSANTAQATVARTATGKITITFPTYYAKCFGYGAQLHLGTPNGYYAQVDSVTLNSSGKCVMVIGTYKGSDDSADDTTGTITWALAVRR